LCAFAIARKSFTIAGTKVPVKAIRIQLSLEGETLVLAPAMEKTGPSMISVGDVPNPAA